MHPLDASTGADAAQEEHGLGYCNITKCCTEVCPEHIHITDNGIIPMKERVVDRKYDPLTWLGSKIGRRRRTDSLLLRGPAFGARLPRIAGVLTGHPAHELVGLPGARGGRGVGLVGRPAAGRPRQRLGVVPVDVLLAGTRVGGHGMPSPKNCPAGGSGRRTTGRTLRAFASRLV